MSPNGGPIAKDNGSQDIGELRDAAVPFAEPPPWLATSIAEFGPTERMLNVVRPIRALSFGGILVFVALLTFLIGQSPYGQSALLVVSIYGLPLCVATWFVTSRVARRLNRKKNHIQQRLFGAGLHLEDGGRVLTDNPHPVLILDTAAAKEASMS